MDLIRSHMEWFMASATMRAQGLHDNALWMSSVDLWTGRDPGPGRPDGVTKRCYRFIESPGGSNLYWDLPLLGFCGAWANVTGEQKFRDASCAYITDYLDRCTAPNGLFYWGNHYFFEAATNGVVWFGGGLPAPLLPEPAEGIYHETRPLRVPAAIFAPTHSTSLHRAVATQAVRHLVDSETGEFNRHGIPISDHPFLEAGGILAEAFCEDAVCGGDPGLELLAERVIGFSFNHRDPHTGLLPVSPGSGRWDESCCTTEVGLRAGCALRCYRLTNRASFLRRAGNALKAWLDYGWNESAGRFYGRLDIATGEPDFSPKTTAHQPDAYSDLWEPLFPIHDYPWQSAQACVDLFEETGDPAFREGAARWMKHLTNQLPARNGSGAYSEHYGRALHFLISARPHGFAVQADELIARLRAEISEHLEVDGRLRSHPGEDRCDAVDGMGFLLWGLLETEHGKRIRSDFDIF